MIVIAYMVPTDCTAADSASGSAKAPSGTSVDSNQGTAWDIRKNYFKRFKWAKEFGPSQNGGQDVIQNGESKGPGYVYPASSGPLFLWPRLIPSGPPASVPTMRDQGIDKYKVKTFGYPVSDTQFQIIQRLDDNMMLEEAFDPERWMWMENAMGAVKATSAANSVANLGRNQALGAIDFVQHFLDNFTVDPGNVWNKIRNNLFMPMALLLLLPGAVLSQVRAIVAQGSSIFGDVNPFDGIIRSIIAIFLIPATYLVVNWGIDVSNSITHSIADGYSGIFHTDMYVDASCAQKRALQIGDDNVNAIPMTSSVNNASSDSADDVYSAEESISFQKGQDDNCASGNQNQAGKAAFPGGGVSPGVTGANPAGSYGLVLDSVKGAGKFTTPMGDLLKKGLENASQSTGLAGLSTASAAGQGYPDEVEPMHKTTQRLAVGGANAALTATWNVLCAFQMAYLYYLFCIGPVVAALWVWPMQQLRQALPSWIEGVITLCFWSLFWNTTILLMAAFKGVGDTGTIVMTALNFLATSSVKYAFDFAGLVKAAGEQAGKEASKGASGGGKGAKEGHGGAAHAGADGHGRGSAVGGALTGANQALSGGKGGGGGGHGATHGAAPSLTSAGGGSSEGGGKGLSAAATLPPQTGAKTGAGGTAGSAGGEGGGGVPTSSTGGSSAGGGLVTSAPPGTSGSASGGQSSSPVTSAGYSAGISSPADMSIGGGGALAAGGASGGAAESGISSGTAATTAPGAGGVDAGMPSFATDTGARKYASGAIPAVNVPGSETMAGTGDSSANMRIGQSGGGISGDLLQSAGGAMPPASSNLVSGGLSGTNMSGGPSFDNATGVPLSNMDVKAAALDGVTSGGILGTDAGVPANVLIPSSQTTDAMSSGAVGGPPLGVPSVAGTESVFLSGSASGSSLPQGAAASGIPVAGDQAKSQFMPQVDSNVALPTSSGGLNAYGQTIVQGADVYPSQTASQGGDVNYNQTGAQDGSAYFSQSAAQGSDAYYSQPMPQPVNDSYASQPPQGSDAYHGQAGPQGNDAYYSQPAAQFVNDSYASTTPQDNAGYITPIGGSGQYQSLADSGRSGESYYSYSQQSGYSPSSEQAANTYYARDSQRESEPAHAAEKHPPQPSTPAGSVHPPQEHRPNPANPTVKIPFAKSQERASVSGDSAPPISSKAQAAGFANTNQPSASGGQQADQNHEAQRKMEGSLQDQMRRQGSAGSKPQKADEEDEEKPSAGNFPWDAE